ncbi:hypothetical protein KAR91_14740, partial [Candidatus Pacearchaeota archaeon]|nr:hypothetical protein [Candidatus Pacearchaeota archaeon]
GATQGTVTSVGDFGAYDDMLVHLETDDLWWLIDSDTADVLTLVSAANNSSTVTQDAKVYDWGTIIDGTADTALTISTGQKGVVLEDFAMTSTGTYAFNATGNANYTTNRIKSASGFKTHSGSSGVATLTLIKHDGVFGFDTRGNSFLVTIHSKVTGNLNHLVYVIENSMVNYIQGGVIDGSASGGNGIFVNLSKVTFGNNSAWGYERIRNCTTGINATGVGFVVLTTNIQYSGNTTDENPNGASNPAYID